MVVDYTQDQSSLSAQQKLTVQLLQPLLAKRRPARILVLKRSGAGDLPLEVANTTQVIRLGSGENHEDAMLKCRISALPFEEAAFDLVILHHLVADGSEIHLAEALRVLSAGGDIVISGLNSSGLRNRIFNRQQQVPALKLFKVCKFLNSQSFNIEKCLLMGIGGFSWPTAKPTWHGLAMPFADRVVVHGHHQSKIMNAHMLRFKQLKSAGRTAVTLDSCSSRESVS